MIHTFDMYHASRGGGKSEGDWGIRIMGEEDDAAAVVECEDAYL
jgi:hypothetical protein